MPTPTPAELAAMAADKETYQRVLRDLVDAAERARRFLSTEMPPGDAARYCNAILAADILLSGRHSLGEGRNSLHRINADGRDGPYEPTPGTGGMSD